MAKIWIDNGVNIDPTWTKVICLSADGKNWESIQKENISGVDCVTVLNPPLESVKTRLQNIYIKLTDGRAISFALQDVASGANAGEHTTWQAETDVAKQTAIAEINGWL